jgi:hypothetical protein
MFSSFLLGRGEGGGEGGRGEGVAPRGGEGMNDHSKLEARQNSISWHILVFRLHLEGSSLYNVHVLCSVFDLLYIARHKYKKNLDVHILTSMHAMSFFKVKIKESSF